MSNIMDSFRLDGKVALVTGATYGIGMAIAEALGAAGAKIAFNARHADKVAEAAHATWKREGETMRRILSPDYRVTPGPEIRH